MGSLADSLLHSSKSAYTGQSGDYVWQGFGSLDRERVEAGRAAVVAAASRRVASLLLLTPASLAFRGRIRTVFTGRRLLHHSSGPTSAIASLS